MVNSIQFHCSHHKIIITHLFHRSLGTRKPGWNAKMKMVHSHQKVNRCLASVIHDDITKPPWLGQCEYPKCEFEWGEWWTIQKSSKNGLPDFRTKPKVSIFSDKWATGPRNQVVAPASFLQPKEAGAAFTDGPRLSGPPLKLWLLKLQPFCFILCFSLWFCRKFRALSK